MAVEPTAPRRDRLVEDSSDVLAEAFLILGEAGGGRLLRSGCLVACSLGSPAEDLNHAVLRVPLRGPQAATVLDEELRAFFPDEVGYSVWDPWPSIDPRSLGYRVLDVPLMIRAAGGVIPADPPGLDVIEVADEPGLRAFGDVLIEAFPLTGLVAGRDRLFDRRILGHPRLRLWVGRADGRAVSVSMAWLTRGYTFIGFIATLAEARGRGYGAAVTWRATLANPAVPALLHASALGRPVYERMGYEVIAPARLWVRAAAGATP